MREGQDLIKRKRSSSKEQEHFSWKLIKYWWLYSFSFSLSVLYWTIEEKEQKHFNFKLIEHWWLYSFSLSLSPYSTEQLNKSNRRRIIWVFSLRGFPLVIAPKSHVSYLCLGVFIWFLSLCSIYNCWFEIFWRRNLHYK